MRPNPLKFLCKRYDGARHNLGIAQLRSVVQLIIARCLSRSAAAFGFSRPSFYQAQAAFRQGGLPALMPHRRGPREAHKLTAEVLALVRQAREQDSSLRAGDLAARVKDRYGISVHPRSIERALVRSQKKPR